MDLDYDSVSRRTANYYDRRLNGFVPHPDVRFVSCAAFHANPGPLLAWARDGRALVVEHDDGRPALTVHSCAPGAGDEDD